METRTGRARPPHRLPPRRWVTILEIEWLTPKVASLLLQGEDLEGFESDGPGAHVKLILPPPGETEIAQPIRYEGMRAVFADGVTPPFLRTYTPLRFDPKRLELEVEMLKHGDAPASNWLIQARAGQRIIVAGPRGGWNPPQDGEWYLVMADDTGIPAATQVVSALPDKPLAVALEVSGQSERRSLPGVPDDLPQWLYRGNDIRLAGKPLEETIRSAELPKGKGYVWAALESGAMRRIRRYLIEEAGLPKEQMVTRGYWKLGTSDHPDGDYGDD